jgi:hypothetical protein
MQEHSMADDVNEKTVQRFVEAIDAGDVATLEAILHPEATWNVHGTLPVSGFYKGRDSILNDFLAQGLGLYEPGTLSIDLTSLVAAGDAVAIEWHAVGRSVTGKSYDNEYAFFFTLRDGLITSVREYFDSLHVKDTLY